MVAKDGLPDNLVSRRIVVAGRRDARRVRLAAVKEPTDWQEEHSPTEAVLVRLTGQKKTTLARRRKSDARMWEAMSGFQQEAAQMIAVAFDMITTGCSARAQQFQRSDRQPPKPVTERQVQRMEDYWRWAKQAQLDGLSHAAVIDILILGESCSRVDAQRHKREGWAKVNLLEALNLYCAQRGWPQNPVDRRAELRY